MPDWGQLPIAITMGDACGIGPKIIAKLFADDKSLPPTLVIGDEGILQRASRLLDLPIAVKVIDSPEESKSTPNIMQVLSLSALPQDLPFIRTSVDHRTAFDTAGTGTASHASLRVAVEQTAILSRRIKSNSGSS